MVDFLVPEEGFSSMFEKILPHLDEGQQRLLAGAVAEMLGNGGITVAAKASGISRATVQRGALDIRGGIAVSDRVRREGGGRKPAAVAQPGLLEALDALVEPESRGDPMCPLRWTTKSTRNLSEELARQGFRASHTVLRRLLPEMGYSVQAPAKTVEGASHPDRDDQFRYIAGQVAEFQAAGQPVISVDTKKKELVGNYDNGGREWQPRGWK
jgi:hypothetical protein